ncbi:MAG: hypothetical protein KJ556_11075 [Gammaproteobacteria bacterium]|nr:hypothetical protein [Gammaproteobacteria bacterium]MBU2056155.1 hypothetical protein [Gammaproteobacteria bacterium]MBU2175659.1 hypothetical protein [Gammaproteobacteria bacterium]MBU2245366.1 hypothetical protein [Gammaproteobacteria bacterium]MBU2345757.1 hypothetical protein [Gammaproteobacteria bacterium]
MSNSQQIFEAWLAGKITASECEQQLDQNTEWYSRFQTAQMIQRQAKAPFFAPVPDIDTMSVFAQQWQRPTQSHSWWPRLSVAFSALALVISLSPLEMQMQDSGLTLSWRGGQQIQQEQLDTLLASYRKEQLDYIQIQLQNTQQQQASQLILLKDYLTEQQTKERRTDMLELVEYLNQQRQSDWHYWHYWQENYQPSQARLDASAVVRPNR